MGFQLPNSGAAVTLRAVELQRSINGALAGAVAAGLWAAQQPLDKKFFESGYDDVELLGKLAVRDKSWPAVGAALHTLNGAAFGAVYAHVRPFVPGPPIVAGLAAGMIENFALWPLGRLVDRYHPARKELTTLGRNRRALAVATWRHLLFGLILGELEGRLNAEDEAELPPPVPVSSNGHGDIEAAVGATPAS
jgi:hypothetical protein